jgi:hypothetical protein
MGTSAATVAGAWRQNLTLVVYYDPERDLTVFAIRLARNPVGVENFARSCGITSAGQRLILRRVGAVHQRTECATRSAIRLLAPREAAGHALPRSAENENMRHDQSCRKRLFSLAEASNSGFQARTQQVNVPGSGQGDLRQGVGQFGRRLPGLP